MAFKAGQQQIPGSAPRQSNIADCLIVPIFLNQENAYSLTFRVLSLYKPISGGKKHDVLGDNGYYMYVLQHSGRALSIGPVVCLAVCPFVRPSVFPYQVLTHDVLF